MKRSDIPFVLAILAIIAGCVISLVTGQSIRDEGTVAGWLIGVATAVSVITAMFRWL